MSIRFPIGRIFDLSDIHRTGRTNSVSKFLMKYIVQSTEGREERGECVHYTVYREPQVVERGCKGEKGLISIQGLCRRNIIQ